MLNLAVNDLTVDDAKAEYKKRFLFYEPHAKQLAFHTAGKTAIERIFVGGNGTGKTTCGRTEDSMHLTGIYPDNWDGLRYEGNNAFWIMSVTTKMTKDNLQLPIIGDDFRKGVINKDQILSRKTGSNGLAEVLIKRKDGGVSTGNFMSYQQGRENLQGSRINFIHMDEEPPFDIFEECKSRQLGVKNPRIMITTSPLKGMTELMMYFFKDPVLHPGVIGINKKYFIQAAWDDNPYLTLEEKEQRRATMKPHELEAREKGIPCIGTGLVYQVPESEFLIDPIEIKPHWSCVFGMDVGFFAPTAVVFLAWDKDHDTIYIYKEYSVSERTAAQHASTLMMMGCDWIPGVCDPAVNQGSQRDGVRLVDDYAKAGLVLNTSKYAKELAVDTVLDRIRTGRFKVFNTCRKFMEEWRSYSRDDKGKIMKGNDHLMNALEFAMLDGLPLAKTNLQHQMNHSANTKKRYF